MNNYVIWKFEISSHFNLIDIPKGSKILTCQIDNKTDRPCVWAMVNPKNETEEKCFIVLPTGKPILDLLKQIHCQIGLSVNEINEYYLKYIATLQRKVFVWHVFEYIRNKLLNELLEENK